jgi:hypothetical protein
MFSQRPKENKEWTHADVWGQRVPGGRNSKSKGPEEEVLSVFRKLSYLVLGAHIPILQMKSRLRKRKGVAYWNSEVEVSMALLEKLAWLESR